MSVNWEKLSGKLTLEQTWQTIPGSETDARDFNDPLPNLSDSSYEGEACYLSKKYPAKEACNHGIRENLVKNKRRYQK